MNRHHNLPRRRAHDRAAVDRTMPIALLGSAVLLPGPTAHRAAHGRSHIDAVPARTGRGGRR